MPRKVLIENSKFPYHITNRSNNREYFYTPLPILWEIMLEKIKYLDQKMNIKSHAFVLMSNHYHWLLSTPDENLSKGMTYFHREVARGANRKSNRINHFFGGRYKWCSIQKEIYYWNTLKYIFRNPVKANLCAQVEDYQFSSLNDHKGVDSWNLCDFFNAPENTIDPNLEWLNTDYDPKIDEALKKALRRRTFKLPKDRNRKIVKLPRCVT